jgi:Putative Zn-dependent protease, contains TPR repeats
MRLIKYLFILSFGFLCLTTTEVLAQDKTPTFQSLISSGDKEYNKKEYIKAKTYYQEALRLRPNDASAKSKLDNTLLRIKEENRKEELFFEHIDNADAYYANNDLEKALNEYNQALKIFPKDEYALGKKSEIATILKDEKDKLASFNEMIKLGDKLLKDERYAEAVMQYESALKVYPNNSAAQAKYQDAKNKKDAYNTKVAEFDRLKSKGEEFTLRKRYAEAISYFEQALQLFPNETELSDKIKELQTKKNIADRYDAKIAEADALYEDQSYAEAKNAYQEALSVIPNDSYALGMITRVDEVMNSPEYKKILEDKANQQLAQQRAEQQRLAAEEAERQRKIQVQNLINTGNQQLTDKKYEEAEQTFNQVLALDPNNATATEKLGVIAGFHEEIQRLKLEAYNNAMVAGNAALNNDNFTEAITQYNIALSNKPNDETAQQQLSIAQQKENHRLQAIENEYNGYIRTADAMMQSKNYEKAIEFYNKAIEVNTGNPYPAEKIEEIGTILANNRLVVLVSSTINIASNQSKRFDFTPVDISTRRGNYVLIKAKNTGDKPFTLYISYGSKNIKNGGFTVTVPNDNKVNDFIIRVGSQYKWFSEDNTWIELLPENGSIEIYTMEITKGN